MSGAAPNSPPLYDSRSADLRKPLLLTGRAAAAILSGVGEFTLPQNTRGGSIDWGGVYGQGIRLTGPWMLRLEVDGRRYSLPESLDRITATRSRVDSFHTIGGIDLDQSVFVEPGRPGVCRAIVLTNPSDAARTVRVVHEFSPFLSPVLAEGTKPYVYTIEANDGVVHVASHGFALRWLSGAPGDTLSLDGAGWPGRKQSGEFGRLSVERDLEVAPKGTCEAAWTIEGGLERALTGGTAAAPTGTWTTRRSASEAEFDAWEARTPVLRFPSDPDLEEGCRLAKGALRMLYSEPEAGLAGLVAGYPWYGSIWCRDLAWMLPALLWMGDVDWVARSIRAVFRFQARSAIPLLAAEAGELPMQLSPGPLFLYGTSDTSLYYPGVVRQLADHSEQTELVRSLLPNLERVVAWGRRRADPKTGFARNGGEIEAMRAAAQGLGRVHYGFDAVDTTIWDSTDRRDHAIDVQVLWIDALRSVADLTDRFGTPGAGAPMRAEAERVAAQIPTAYAWPEERYLVDSLRAGSDGRLEKLRPNALRAVTAGLLPFAMAKASVERAFSADLLTAWGMRTLSDRSPTYDPQAYHDGQVWSIATAWAASAALSVGDAERGGSLLRLLARRIVREGGYAHECYRGDRDEPYDSCFLLGFSVAPFLTTVFERLWGLSVRDAGRGLSVRPCFPPEWHSASLERLPLGGASVDLDWSDGDLSITYHGPGNVTVETAEGHGTVTRDSPVRLGCPGRPKPS